MKHDGLGIEEEIEVTWSLFLGQYVTTVHYIHLNRYNSKS